MSVPVANTLPPSPPAVRARLSSREEDYLARLALNATRKQIAAEDGVSSQMVSKIVDRAMTKLGADSLVDAFRAMGWLRPGGTM